jgi:membrane protease YdiL (CAAX protease family)
VEFQALNHVFASITPDALLQVGVNLALLVPLTLIAALLMRRAPRWTPLVQAFAFLALATLILFLSVAQLIPGLPRLHWNWDGKLLSLAFVVAFIALTPKLSFAQSGFTLRQNGGALSAILCGVLICAILWTDAFVEGGHFKTPATEALLYQAIIPGIHEEPTYRGVALVLFDRAFRDRRWNLLGAPIGWGAVLTSVFFGIGHGPGFEHGQMQIAWTPILLTGAVGFLLAWMRARTGSLLLPVVFHNIVNVGLQFVG